MYRNKMMGGQGVEGDHLDEHDQLRLEREGISCDPNISKLIRDIATMSGGEAGVGLIGVGRRRYARSVMAIHEGMQPHEDNPIVIIVKGCWLTKGVRLMYFTEVHFTNGMAGGKVGKVHRNLSRVHKGADKDKRMFIDKNYF
ncbi:hypothetical protein CR513_48170, partial [Mucuna pruriens]